MRIICGLALALLLKGSVAYLPPRPLFVTFTPVALDRDDPGRRRVGGLLFDRGWRLTSNSHDFGGISSMHVSGTGHVMAVSDRGSVLEFKAPPRGNVEPLRRRPVPKGPGPRTGFGLFDRDIESMTVDPASGRIWLGFEVWHVIYRYRPDFSAADGWRARPGKMRHWWKNSGAEALVRLHDGRFVVFSEGHDGSSQPKEALLFARDPLLGQGAPLRFFYRPPSGFRPTDAAELPDGRLLVLNRHFSLFDGVSAAITLVDTKRIRRDRVVPGLEIARLVRPLTVDNMEALSVVREANGKIAVWLGSDDNFSFIQQTLLMKFELDPAVLRRPE